MIKFCQHCKDNNVVTYCGVGGYDWSYLDTAKKCNECGGDFIDIDFPAPDLRILTQVSQDVNFIEAMIKLRQDDIIEYESRMSQFRTQVQQQEQANKAAEEKSKPHCPTCGSTNIAKISGTSKAASVALWGIFSQKVKKQWHCNSCKYEW